MMEWISVEDRLPEQGESVLFTCRVDSDFTDIELGEWTGKYSDGGALVMDYGDETDWYPCTHWMPLPAPPATEGEVDKC